MLSRPDKLQGNTDFRIMSLLDDKPEITQRELTRELGLSVCRDSY